MIPRRVPPATYPNDISLDHLIERRVRERIRNLAKHTPVDRELVERVRLQELERVRRAIGGEGEE